MKKMFALIAAVVAFGTLANAQSHISNESLTRQKSELTVAFDIDSEGSDISSNLKEVIRPYICNGADTLWLDAVEVYGKGRFLRERQENHLDGNKQWTLTENQLMAGEKYHFTQTIEMERWMLTSDLKVRRFVEGCGRCNEGDSDEYIASTDLRTLPPFEIVDASRRWDFGQDNLEIIFKVSKIEIDSTVFNNEVTFGKILAAVDKIHSNPNYKIDKIQVSGYASPEGGRKFNNWLGENRAKALIDYIIAQRPDYGLTYDNFEIVNGDENWKGLRAVLDDSKMAARDEVIAIIDNSELSNEAKKHRIKAMKNGRVWQSMLKEIYPHLRSAQYQALYYDSTNDKAVEIINQANELIREGDFTEAYDLAMRVSNDHRAYNTIGVALMGQYEFEKAIEWFEKAVAETGCQASQKNIDAIKVEYGETIK